MFQIDKESRTPIYEQIIESVERSILLGLVTEGEKIPSVRELSSMLSLNPNTVQKAYFDLEQRQITRSEVGIGRFIASGAVEILRKRAQGQLGNLRGVLENLLAAGCDKSQILEMIEEVFKGA